MPLSRLSIHPGKLDDHLAQDEICFATKHSHVLPIHVHSLAKVTRILLHWATFLDVGFGKSLVTRISWLELLLDASLDTGRLFQAASLFVRCRDNKLSVNGGT